jgi:hypothetical protein
MFLADVLRIRSIEKQTFPLLLLAVWSLHLRLNCVKFNVNDYIQENKNELRKIDTIQY